MKKIELALKSERMKEDCYPHEDDKILTEEIIDLHCPNEIGLADKEDCKTNEEEWKCINCWNEEVNLKKKV